MLDAMSYYPAPSKAECAVEMKAHLKSIIRAASTPQEIKLQKMIDLYSDKELVDKCAAFLEPIPHERLGSLTGWFMAAKEEFCNRFVKKVLCLDARKKIIRCKIRVIGKFMVLFRRTIERIYTPESDYARATKLKYKHLFKTTSSSFTQGAAAEESEEEEDCGYYITPVPPPPRQREPRPPPSSALKYRV